MGILASLLPGARDLRAPLAAGYIFLFSVWVVFFEDLPTETEAEGLVRSLYELSELIGPVATAVGVSFFAYLIGGVFESIAQIGTQVARARADERWRYRDYLDHVHRELLFTPGIRKKILESELSGGHVRTRVFSANMDRELEVIRARVRAEHPTLSGEYDLLRAEASFRSAIFIPLTVLIVAVTVVSGEWLAVGAVPLVGILIVQWFQLDARATLALTGAVTSGKISPPLLERLRAEIENLGPGEDFSPYSD